MRYLYPLLLSILALLFLQSCTTTDDRRDPSAPRKYFIPDEEVVYKTDITFANRDAEFLVTADAIYVMYGRNYAYLNPAYVCSYAIFPYEPILEGDLIKIDCRGGGEGARYFQFSDTTKAKIIYEKISAARSGTFSRLKHDVSSKAGSKSTKPPRHFQITEDIVYRTKTSYGGREAELVISELGVYLLYGGSDVYKNPAYECLYKNFLRMPVEKPGLIGITCKKSRFLNTFYYFQIPDPKDRDIAVKKISDQMSDKTIMVWNDAWRNKHLMIAEESFKVTGVTSPETCIPDQMIDKSQNSEDFIYAPGVVLHPNVLPYVVADPALLVFVFFGGILVDIDNLIQSWKYRKVEKDLTTQTLLIRSSTELSVVLAITADSILKNKVTYISKPCKAIAEEDSDIGAVDPHLAYKVLRDSFATIVEADTFSGKLKTYDNPTDKGIDTQLWISSSFNIINTESGSVINYIKIQYVNSRPLNVSDVNEINDDLVEDMLQDAYREIAGLVVDSLLSIE